MPVMLVEGNAETEASRAEIYYKSLAVRVMLAINAFELMAPGSYRKKYNLFVRFLNLVKLQLPNAPLIFIIVCYL